jgi:mannose/cellobiose epimerase-like protein (N-acyl-D-glucosamine 2-epimerase family)
MMILLLYCWCLRQAMGWTLDSKQAAPHGISLDEGARRRTGGEVE